MERDWGEGGVNLKRTDKSISKTNNLLIEKKRGEIKGTPLLQFQERTAREKNLWVLFSLPLSLQNSALKHVV